MRFAWLILLGSSLVGCATGGDDSLEGGTGKADGNGSCTVPEYGDGTCQIDLACDVPDIDCYTAFDSDDTAAAWLNAQMPSTVVASTDPRAMRAHDLVDRAYALFKSHVQLGAMADKPIRTVVIEGEPNAFVLGDATTHKGGWSVQVQTGILDGRFTDDEIIGIMQHELTHLAKLHFLPEVDDRIRKFYVAPDGKEPIGEQTPENAFAKQYGSAWRKASQLIGWFTNPELGDLPIGGDLGSIFYWFATEQLATTCATQVSAYTSVYTPLSQAINKLDYSLEVEPALVPQIKPALDNLLACSAANPQTLRAYLDAQSPDWVPYIQPMLDTNEVAVLDQPVLQAIVTLTHTRRMQMIAAQDGFAHDTARPWSALRFYSFEEAADDGWIRSYQAAHLDGPGSFKGAFLLFLDTQAAACDAALAANAAPYGVDLADEHHGDCWRIAHAAQMGAPATTTSRAVDDDDGEQRIAHEPRKIPQRPGAHPIY